MEKKMKIYIDTEQQLSNNGATGFFLLNKDGIRPEIINAGKYVLSMPKSDKALSYQILTNEYDVNFIFDDNIPILNFYPVPQLLIFATDSFGGCFVSTNVTADIAQKKAPIFYLDQDFKVYYLSPNLKSFLELVIFNPLWKKQLNMPINEKLHFSKSGQEYLINKFNLRNKNAVIDLDKAKTESICIYSSLDDAKKEMQFFDIDEIKYNYDKY